MPPQLNDEQRQDSEKRISEFKEKITELSEEYQVDFVAFPVPEPLQNGVFATRIQIQFIDKKYTPIPSPIIIEK